MQILEGLWTIVNINIENNNQTEDFMSKIQEIKKINEWKRFDNKKMKKRNRNNMKDLINLRQLLVREKKVIQ